MRKTSKPWALKGQKINVMWKVNNTWILSAGNDAGVHNEERKLSQNQACSECTHCLSRPICQVCFAAGQAGHNIASMLQMEKKERVKF